MHHFEANKISIKTRFWIVFFSPHQISKLKRERLGFWCEDFTTRQFSRQTFCHIVRFLNTSLYKNEIFKKIGFSIKRSWVWKIFRNQILKKKMYLEKVFWLNLLSKNDNFPFSWFFNVSFWNKQIFNKNQIFN